MQRPRMSRNGPLLVSGTPVPSSTTPLVILLSALACLSSASPRFVARSRILRPPRHLAVRWMQSNPPAATNWRPFKKLICADVRASARALAAADPAASAAIGHRSPLPAALIERVPPSEKLVLNFVLSYLETEALPAQLLVNGANARVSNI